MHNTARNGLQWLLVSHSQSLACAWSIRQGSSISRSGVRLSSFLPACSHLRHRGTVGKSRVCGGPCFHQKRSISDTRVMLTNHKNIFVSRCFGTVLLFSYKITCSDKLFIRREMHHNTPSSPTNMIVNTDYAIYIH